MDNQPGAENPLKNAEEPVLTKRQRRLSILYSGMAFFVGYVLTAGPAGFIVRRFDMPMIGAIVEILYKPLILIIKMDIPVLSAAIKGWVSLFQ